MVMVENVRGRPSDFVYNFHIDDNIQGQGLGSRLTCYNILLTFLGTIKYAICRMTTPKTYQRLSDFVSETYTILLLGMPSKMTHCMANKQCQS